MPRLPCVFLSGVKPHRHAGVLARTLKPFSSPPQQRPTFGPRIAMPAPRGVTLAPLAGDVNGDGLVNSADTGIVGDTNGDGVVDDLDTGLVGDTNGGLAATAAITNQLVPFGGLTIAGVPVSMEMRRAKDAAPRSKVVRPRARYHVYTGLSGLDAGQQEAADISRCFGFFPALGSES